MLYQVTLNLYFSDRDEANDFYHDGQVALPKATVVNPGTDDQECSRIEWVENHHDENPNLPCVVIQHDNNCPPPYSVNLFL